MLGANYGGLKIRVSVVRFHPWPSFKIIVNYDWIDLPLRDGIKRAKCFGSSRVQHAVLRALRLPTAKLVSSELHKPLD